MIVRPKTAMAQQLLAPAVIAFTCLILFATYFYYSSATSVNSSLERFENSIVETSPKSQSQAAPGPPRVHLVDTLVKASLFANTALVKPLELVKNEVSCPERGGKNTQCGKVFAEYRFLVPKTGDYYLYIQVRAPTLNDNSLWIGQVNANDKFYEDAACHGQNLGALVPHKHRAGNALLCFPKYLGKNAKKGLAPFYSDCCYAGLGPRNNERACVLDLEVESGPKWNQFPRAFHGNAREQIILHVYAREDGTSWTNLVLSAKPDLDEQALARLPKKSLAKLAEEDTTP